MYSIKVLLYKTQYFYIAENDVLLTTHTHTHTHTMHCCVSTAKWLHKLTTLPIMLKYCVFPVSLSH